MTVTSAPTDELQSAPTPERTNVSTLLRLGTGSAWMVYLLFAASNTAFALSTLDRVASPWPVIAALVIVNGVAILLVRWHSDPMPALWAWAVVLATALGSALVMWQVVDIDSPGREIWHVFANMWMLFFVILRGRTGVAWTGFAAMLAVHAAWATDVGLGVLGELLRFQTNAGILLVASLFAVALRRVSRHINSLNRRSVELASATAVAQAQREARLAELRDTAGPLLARVASGPALSWENQVECLLAEAALRDGVRAPSLSIPEIVSATKAARRRGVDVTLLDDRGEQLPTAAAMKTLAARVAETLHNVPSGRVAVRLAPQGRRAAASLVVETDGRVRRIDLDDNAQPLPPGT
jgi:hypothetical protein